MQHELGEREDSELEEGELDDDEDDTTAAAAAGDRDDAGELGDDKVDDERAAGGLHSTRFRLNFNRTDF